MHCIFFLPIVSIDVFIFLQVGANMVGIKSQFSVVVTRSKELEGSLVTKESQIALTSKRIRELVF